MLPVDEHACHHEVGTWELRHLPAQSERLFLELLEEFGMDELQQAGVAVRGEDGVPTMSLRLAGTAVSALPLMDVIGGPPFDLLLPDGLLIGNESPFWAVAHDYRIAHHLRHSDGLYLLVPQLEDVLACHYLGLAAAPLLGTMPLTRSGLQYIEELTRPAETARLLESVETPMTDDATDRGPQPVQEIEEAGVGDSQSSENTSAESESLSADDFDLIDLQVDEPLNIDLIVTQWSFFEAQLAAERPFREFVAELSRAERYSTADLNQVAIWIPNTHDQERFCYARSIEDRELERTAVLQSLEDRCYSIPTDQSHQIEPWRTPNTFCESRAALYRTLRDPYAGSDERNEAMNAYLLFLERELIGPLIQDSIGHRDRISTLLKLEAANIALFLQSHAPILQAEITHAGFGTAVDQFMENVERRVRTHVQMGGTLIRIYRELHR